MDRPFIFGTAYSVKGNILQQLKNPLNKKPIGVLPQRIMSCSHHDFSRRSTNHDILWARENQLSGAKGNPLAKEWNSKVNFCVTFCVLKVSLFVSCSCHLKLCHLQICVLICVLSFICVCHLCLSFLCHSCLSWEVEITVKFCGGARSSCRTCLELPGRFHKNCLCSLTNLIFTASLKEHLQIWRKYKDNCMFKIHKLFFFIVPWTRHFSVQSAAGLRLILRQLHLGRQKLKTN